MNIVICIYVMIEMKLTSFSKRKPWIHDVYLFSITANSSIYIYISRSTATKLRGGISRKCLVELRSVHPSLWEGGDSPARNEAKKARDSLGLKIGTACPAPLNVANVTP